MIAKCVCGGKAELWKDEHPGIAVRCSACKRFGKPMDTEAEAIADWNAYEDYFRKLRGLDGKHAD